MGGCSPTSTRRTSLFHGGLNGGAGVKKPRGLAAATLFGIVSLLGAGCGGAMGAQDTSERMGFINAAVRLMTSDGLTITRVHVSVTPAGVVQDLTYDSPTDQYVGLITTPTGSQTVTATAFAGPILVGTGTAVAAVTKRGTTGILIRILDNSAPTPGQDHGPIITAISASTLTPMVGDVVDLAVSAFDPDGDPISYQWTQDCGGAFATPTASTSTWSSNSALPCVITAMATSRGVSDTAHLSLSVQAATGSVALTATFIPSPYVSRVTISGPGLSCDVPRDATDASCRPAIAPSSILSASVTFDPMPADSGATVMFSDSCGGSSTGTGVDLVAGTASFDWTAPAATTSCLLTAAVSREGLSDAEQVAVAVQ